MKLYFIFSCSGDSFGIDGECEEAPFSHSHHFEHPHERFNNIYSLMKYEIFRGEFNGSKSEFEYPLIDIPDEYVFQFMVMGLQDYDYIVYNYRTKRILLGSKASSIRYTASEEGSGNNSSKYSNPRGYGIVGNQINTDDEEEEQYLIDYGVQEKRRKYREPYKVELDSTNGYQEILEVLKPYYLDLAYKMYTYMFNHLSNKQPIGIETNSVYGAPNDYPRRAKAHVVKGSDDRFAMKLDDDEFEVLYDEWLNDGELFVENKKLGRIYKINEAFLRAWYNDSYKIFTEKTDYWDNMED